MEEEARRLGTFLGRPLTSQRLETPSRRRDGAGDGVELCAAPSHVACATVSATSEMIGRFRVSEPLTSFPPLAFRWTRGVESGETALRPVRIDCAVTLHLARDDEIISRCIVLLQVNRREPYLTPLHP